MKWNEIQRWEKGVTRSRSCVGGGVGVACDVICGDDVGECRGKVEI